MVNNTGWGPPKGYQGAAGTADPRVELLIPVARACYEAQFTERFDDLNPASIDYALALQVGRAAIAAMAAVLLEPHP